jgi:quercetin dioxygenase-like cupin family protein
MLNIRKNIIIGLLAVFLFLSFKQIEKAKTEVVTLAETTKSWNGDDLPNYPEGKPKITVLKITIPPHFKLSVHKHLVINAGVLIKGKLTVVDENKNTLHLKAGDALVEMVNKYHYGINEGNKPAEIIVFYAGAEGIPITVAKEVQSEDH